MQFLEEVENGWLLNRQESFAGDPSARCASIRKGRTTSARMITKKVLRSVLDGGVATPAEHHIWPRSVTSAAGNSSLKMLPPPARGW
jgi:hypothetical protein